MPAGVSGSPLPLSELGTLVTGSLLVTSSLDDSLDASLEGSLDGSEDVTSSVMLSLLLLSSRPPVLVDGSLTLSLVDGFFVHPTSIVKSKIKVIFGYFFVFTSKVIVIITRLKNTYMRYGKKWVIKVWPFAYRYYPRY